MAQWGMKIKVFDKRFGLLPRQQNLRESRETTRGEGKGMVCGGYGNETYLSACRKCPPGYQNSHRRFNPLFDYP